MTVQPRGEEHTIHSLSHTRQVLRVRGRLSASTPITMDQVRIHPHPGYTSASALGRLPRLHPRSCPRHAGFNVLDAV